MFVEWLFSARQSCRCLGYISEQNGKERKKERTKERKKEGKKERREGKKRKETTSTPCPCEAFILVESASKKHNE